MGAMTLAPLIFFVAGASGLQVASYAPGWSFLDPGNAKIFQNRGGGGADSLLEAPLFLSRSFGLWFLVSLTACWGYSSSEAGR